MMAIKKQNIILMLRVGQQGAKAKSLVGPVKKAEIVAVWPLVIGHHLTDVRINHATFGGRNLIVALITMRQSEWEFILISDS